MTEPITPQQTEQPKTPAPTTDLPPAEAGFSMNWTMVDGKGANVQLTMRGAVLADWPYVFTERAAFMDKALAHGWALPNQGKPAPLQAPAIGQAAQADKGEAAPKTEGPKPAPRHTPVTDGGTQGGREIKVIKTSKVTVEPKGDGKTRVSFFAAGHNYADVYSTKPIEKWVEILGWEAEVFNKAESYQLSAEVGYTLSDKKNTAGNAYKDIEYVKVA